MSSGNVSLKDMSSSLGGGHPRDRQYSYQDLAHPSLQEVLRNHNASTFKLVKTGKSEKRGAVKGLYKEGEERRE